LNTIIEFLSIISEKCLIQINIPNGRIDMIISVKYPIVFKNRLDLVFLGLFKLDILTSLDMRCQIQKKL
jgi:hypothetical protein